MAASDYRLCDVCNLKAFYDANLSYDFSEYPETGLWNLGDWSVLCRDCAKTHKTLIVTIEPTSAANGEGDPK